MAKVLPRDERRFDVVVYGATGFTGRLVAEELARHPELEVGRWAIAGRSESKLRSVRAHLTSIHPDCAQLDLIVASSEDRGALEAMADQTRVIATTVGPYAIHGEPLVAACVARHTDYVDLTGEPAWWASMIERYHERAEAAGTILVPCCGFDSIPHDLGALHCASQLPEGPRRTIDGYVRGVGRFSGGTMHSGIHAMANMRRDRSQMRGRRTGVRGTKPKGLHFAEPVAHWVLPMPTIDPLVVKRSALLRPDAFGHDFDYHHYLQGRSLAQLGALMGSVGVAFGLAQTRPGRALLERLVPASGEGPDEAARKRGWFRITFVGRGGGRKVVTEVRGGDPGYGETAKMIAEAALTLAHQREELPAKGGVLTPASAMGQLLIDRLDRRGITFGLVEDVEDSAPISA